MSETGNIAQLFALVVGAVYLLVGIAGFAVTGFEGITTNGDEHLLGFQLNVFHNIVHLVIGLVLLVVSRVPDPTVAQGVLIGGGLVYILAAGLGFLNELQILSINDELDPDNFLHLFSGIAALAVGIIGARQSSARMATA
jgi:hypothetical protein